MMCGGRGALFRGDGDDTRLDKCYSFEFAANAWRLRGRMPEVKSEVERDFLSISYYRRRRHRSTYK